MKAHDALIVIYAKFCSPLEKAS